MERRLRPSRAQPSNSGGVSLTSSGFVSDALTLGDRLTVNAGVRFDHSRAISQDLHAVDLRGARNRRHVSGLGTLYTWNVWSPRLGVTAKLTSDGRTMLRASYGRFSQGVLTGEIGLFHPAGTPITTMGFDSATGGYTRLVSVVDNQINLRLDRDTRAPHTDEYSVGVDRELGRRIAVAIAYVRKDGANFIGWTDIGGQYREDTRTLIDGRSVPVFELVNNTTRSPLTADESRRILDDVQRPRAGRRKTAVQRLAGIRLVHAVENIRTAAVQRDDCRRGAGQHDPPPTRHIRSRSQRPHQRARSAARRSAAYLPRDGQRGCATNRHGDRRQHAVLQRQAVGGSRTGWAAPDQQSGDSARAARAAGLPSVVIAGAAGHAGLEDVLLRRSRRIELLVDILNVLNDTAEEGLVSENLFSSNFGLPNRFVIRAERWSASE